MPAPSVWAINLSSARWKITERHPVANQRFEAVAVYTIRRTQIIRASLGECWDFFSNPKNLEKITPPWLGFEVKSDLPASIYPGLMIEYRVAPILRIRLSWLTEIVHVDAPNHFVDEQRLGPYKVWHHEHLFRELPGGEVEVRDLVHYVPPLGLFAPLVNVIAVRPQLERIFAFRTEAVARIFAAS